MTIILSIIIICHLFPFFDVEVSSRRIWWFIILFQDLSTKHKGMSIIFYFKIYLLTYSAWSLYLINMILNINEN
jgi:hypothetical protein